MAHRSFDLIDAAGISHRVNLSTDRRTPPAMDAAPPGMRRRTARDDDPEQAPGTKLTPEVVLAMVQQLLNNSGPDDATDFANQFAEMMAGYEPGNPENGSDWAVGGAKMPRPRANDAPAFRPRTGGAQDRRLAEDAASRRSLARMDPVLASYLDRIGDGGYR
jgi:hypothetical protein